MTLLVLGIDGAVREYVEEAFDRGVMPNLERVAEEGTMDNMKSSNPPITIPAWPSMFSGQEPDKFDTFHMTEMDENYSVNSTSSNKWNDEMLWNNIDGRFGLINIPGNSPVRPVNGYMVEGFPMVMEPGFYPESLEDELPDFNFISKGKKSTAQGRREVYLHNYRRRKEVFDEIDQDVNVRIEIYQLTDTLAHVAKNIDQIMEAYSEVDEMIGERMEEYDDIMVVSDHGFTEVEKFFYINSWLEDKGFLKREEEDTSASLMSKLKRTLMPLAETRLKPYLKAVNDFLKTKSDIDLSPDGKGVENIDFSQTEAFSYRSGAVTYGDININDDRYSSPVVEDREQKIEQIIELLEKETFIENVWRREEIYDEPENMPDIVFKTDLSTGAGISLSDKTVFNMKGYVHSDVGIVAFRGPSFGELDSRQNLEDVAPTIAKYLGQEIDVDGEPMDVFVDSFESEKPSKSEDLSELDI
jgi:predicted AlkP superfamily phosphohydrolase/phosphomutase